MPRAVFKRWIFWLSLHFKSAPDRSGSSHLAEVLLKSSHTFSETATSQGLGFFPSFEGEDHKFVYQETNFHKAMGPRDDVDTGESSQRTGTRENSSRA